MSDAARPPAIERQRLDRALIEAGRRADPVTRAQIEAFEAILRQRRRGGLMPGASLREEIDRLTMPEITDPSIFAASRSMELLHHVIESILPNLESGDDVTAIAAALIDEEIASRREIEQRLQSEGNLT